MNRSIVRELERLRRQLISSMKKMAWDAGFKTTKRSCSIFRIQTGKVKLAKVRTDVKITGQQRWGVEVFVQIYGDSPTRDPFCRVFYLSHTKSVKAWFRSILAELKRSCMLRVMLM
jgi:hypothetical protein